MIRIYNYFITSYLLGFDNIFKVLLYRLFKNFGIFEVIQKVTNCPNIEIIADESLKPLVESKQWHSFSKKYSISNSEKLIRGYVNVFGKQSVMVGSPPDWLKDPFSFYKLKNERKHWSSFSDNGEIDIKKMWDLSRFNWINTFSRGWRWTKDERYLKYLNLWVESWCKENPINSGANWMCGQEVSIRLINIMLSWYVIEGKNSLENFPQNRIDFVISHLSRINLTKFYAEAQNNNHSISESAALYIGGKWLSKSSLSNHKIGRYYSKIGKKRLENNIQKLVQKDGSFSQNSINYHRFLVDTICQVEIWRRIFKDNLFSDNFYKRCDLAIEWLDIFVDPITGKIPNLGANDGTYCYQLHSLPYENFKPTLQLGFFLFKKRMRYSEGAWDEALFILGIKYEKFYKSKKVFIENRRYLKKEKKLYYFPDGGYVVIKVNDYSWSLLRLPRYKFRPSQCDPLHFDLWRNGENILRDGGSFSYNDSDNLMNYFNGINSHNTIQFDDFNPMPKISRFLWGNWLETESEPILINKKLFTKISSSYKCKFGRHLRTVLVDETGYNWEILDDISGEFKKATLRWRLCRQNWKIKDNSVIANGIKITVKSNKDISSFKLNDGLESLDYNSKNKLQVLEIISKNSPTKIKTLINFKND